MSASLHGAALRVLFATPELSPWVKAGGLGDVSHDLPHALAQSEVDVRVLLPAYPAMREIFPAAREIAVFATPGGALAPARLLEARDGAVGLYLLDCPAYYARPGTIYQSPQGADWPDNALRFGLLSRIAALLGQPDTPLEWRPQLVHCNDWQTGLAPAFLAYAGSGVAASLMTVHNLAYQGIFPRATLEALGLPPQSFSIEGLEYYGQISFLKAGLHYATRLSTVSPAYAREIQQPVLGFGLDGLLRRRAAHLTGILNGIDERLWNPAADAHLEQPYDAGALQDKQANKAALQRDFALPQAPHSPLLGLVGRLVEQKGIDLVIAAAQEWAREGVQLALQGTGSARFETQLRELAARYPHCVSVRIGFDERLAHRIEAGADMFLMPSRFEPCGLNQFYSMRYGTPPVVHRTGGLADSVVDATEQTLAEGTATGFSFEEATAQALLEAVRRAVALYREPAAWRQLQRNGMARDFSWANAARNYLRVYRSALSG